MASTWDLFGGAIAASCVAVIGLPSLAGCGSKNPEPGVPRSLVRVGGHGVPSPPRAVTFDDVPKGGATPRHFEAIQASSLSLKDAELDTLHRNGFVISDRRRFPTFAFGYAAIYVDDLPVYISADSILDPVHRSYDTILKTFERGVLIPELGKMLDNMRWKLAAGAAHSFGSEAEADADLYLTVPLRLLRPDSVSTVAGGDATRVDKYVASAMSAAGIGPAEIFGKHRPVDFSQYKPRGHYAGDPALERYFRAMMWFGREDLRVVDQNEVHRRSLRGMLALRSLLDADDLKRWASIDHALDAFVGKRDSMSFSEVDELQKDLGASSSLSALKMPDARWLAAFDRTNAGAQRIASHVRDGETGPNGSTTPLARSFSPFGQRYVVDSEAFSKLVYDRLPKLDGPERVMPKPLDVAYTVFGNAHAKSLLASDIKQYGALSSALEQTRDDVDSRDASEWQENLYNTWLLALRALSPGADGSGSLPKVARTEPWARRILNAQLASWAELRHNTILYAKQSYTATILCEYPDAYVDPYPRFYVALGDFARRGKEAAAVFESKPADAKAPRTLATMVREYFQNLEDVVTVFADMADRELRGEEFTSEEMKFVNEAVQVKRHVESGGCGGGAVTQWLEGWYSKLFFERDDSLQYAPTIADVHTDPNTTKVLHVGTGKPQLMAVTVDTCKGPSTYVGLAFSYYEETTDNFNRLTDKEWEGIVDSRTSPQWLSGIIAYPPKKAVQRP